MYDILNKFTDIEKEEAKVSSSIPTGLDNNITSFVTDEDCIDLFLFPVSVCGIVKDINPSTLSVYSKYEECIGGESGGYSFNKFEQYDEIMEKFQNRNPLLETKIDTEDY